MTKRSVMGACLVGLLVVGCSLGHAAIYYIDDSSGTNASGSTFSVSPAASWAVQTTTGYAYGDYYTYEKAGITVPGTATYAFNGPTDTYYVYAGWSPPATPVRTQTGIITVNGTSGTIAATGINHRLLADGSAPGADLRGSGFFPVTAGTAYQAIELGPGSTIVYSDLDNDRLSADVVVLSTDLLIDDISTLTTDVNSAYVLTWNTYTNNVGEYSYGYSYAAAPAGGAAGDTFEYNIGAALGAGTVVNKDLEVSWLASTSRDPNVTYRITHTGGTTDVKVNQLRNAAGATVSGPVWSGFRSLGVYEFDAASKVELIASGGGATAADTIALGRVIPRNRYGIVADFDDGNSSTAVDGYPGTAGKGWATAWSPYDTGSITRVTTANPIEGPDDPYLSFVSTKAGNHMVRRQYQQYAEVDPAEPHRITWKWRFDGDVADMTTFGDRIHFFGDDAAETGSALGNSWLISWTDASGTSYTVPDREWWFFDGAADNAYNGANMVSSGIGLEAGIVYEFEVMVYPADGKYDAWMSNGTDIFAAYGLTFRNRTTGVYDWLHFGGLTSADSDDWAFSLDSVRVYVPEPATVAILLGGLGMLARRRRRR